MADTEIRHSIIIAAPIDTVWAEITKIGTRQRAQLDSVLETSFRPGDPLYYKSQDGSRIFMVGRVLEFDPPTTLSSCPAPLLPSWCYPSWPTSWPGCSPSGPRRAAKPRRCSMRTLFPRS